MKSVLGRHETETIEQQVLQGIQVWHKEEKWLVDMPELRGVCLRTSCVSCRVPGWYVLELDFAHDLPARQWVLQNIYKVFAHLDIRVGNHRKLVDACPYPVYPWMNHVFCGSHFVLWGVHKRNL